LLEYSRNVQNGIKTISNHFRNRHARLRPANRIFVAREEIRLVLKPKAKGVFPIKPRILYLDENGKYKSHGPEPTTITVKELGISGWIKARAL
jgi:hypothetical protein